jgi:uncharacterized protein YecE (DUF72 family)
MIRLGTCSWKYDSWKGIIYPEVNNLDYLKEYAKHFNTVEIDQWFWSLFSTSKIVLPSKNIAKDYSDSVPADFLFTIKVPNSLTLTHFYKKNKSDELIKNPHFLSADLFIEFLQSIKPLHSKIGCLLFQFEYLNKDKMINQSIFENLFADFREKISNCNLPIGIEIRNPNYLNIKYFNFLNRLELIPVLTEGYYMPIVTEIFNQFALNDFKTIVIRLHGSDRSGIEKLSNENWNQIYVNRIEEINRLSELFMDLLSKKVDLFVNVNNHFEGSAPLTINRIKNILNQNI